METYFKNKFMLFRLLEVSLEANQGKWSKPGVTLKRHNFSSLCPFGLKYGALESSQ